jgi:hypothetical protein
MTTKVLIVGNPRETHVGRHFMNGAPNAGLEAQIMDLAEAYEGPRWIKSLCWHLLGKRPQRLNRFGDGFSNQRRIGISQRFRL